MYLILKVLSVVKQRIDASLTEDDAHLLAAARTWFAGRGAKVPEPPIKMIAQHHQQTQHNHHYTPVTGNDMFSIITL